VTGTPASFIARSRLFFIVGLLALVIALVLVGTTLLSERAISSGLLQRSGPAVGALAPDFRLMDASSGAPVSLSSLRGKPVWINFWASWCPGCKDEMPAIEKVYQRHHASGFQVLGINVQESRDTALSFVSSGNFHWTFLLDSDGRTADLYYVNGLPYHVFIAPNGTIKAIYPGILDEKGMDNYVQQILKNP
jgi:thiol-disulfide isomerase/thioredoxin